MIILGCFSPRSDQKLFGSNNALGCPPRSARTNLDRFRVFVFMVCIVVQILSNLLRLYLSRKDSSSVVLPLPQLLSRKDSSSVVLPLPQLLSRKDSSSVVLPLPPLLWE